MSKTENKQDSFGRAMAELFGKNKDAGEPQKVTDASAAAGINSEPPVEPPAPTQRVAEPEPAPVPPPPPKPYFADAGVPPRRANTTYFAAGTVIEGTLRSDSDVEIVGDFKGEIASDGTVIIHANTVSSIAAHDLRLVGATLTGDVTASGKVEVDRASSVRGNIRAEAVESSGPIRGNLNVSGLVELKDGSSLTGDARTAQMIVTRGVKVNGRIDVEP
ncbi:MAG: polymer-forming cytoskeletal protein [Oscillospiraceae bacterium]|nr:polymer-forming cytoskeletal protein [Oscillospiraceae bacterium]